MRLSNRFFGPFRITRSAGDPDNVISDIKRHELPDTAAIYVVMAGDTALMTCKGKSED